MRYAVCDMRYAVFHWFYVNFISKIWYYFYIVKSSLKIVLKATILYIYDLYIINFYFIVIIKFKHNTRLYSANLSKGLDISIPLISDASGPKCFYAPNFKIEPLVLGDFIGEVSAGSSVNFRNIIINPHGNGTHTECVGHITAEPFTINQCLTEFHFLAQLVTVDPEKSNGQDSIITAPVLKNILNNKGSTPAVIVRTLPNGKEKLTKDYSGTNPPYFSEDAIHYLNSRNIIHLITDLPSVDREEDGGLLLSHKAYWEWPHFPNKKKTITELVYIDNMVEDGVYLCNIQIASIESDASPSKIVIYPLNKFKK